MSPSEPGGQVCTRGTCLQSPTSLPKAKSGASGIVSMILEKAGEKQLKFVKGSGAGECPADIKSESWHIPVPLRTTSCQFKTLEMNLHLLLVHPFLLLPVSPAGTSVSISFLLTAGAGGNTMCASTVPPSLLAPPVLPQQPWCPPEWLQGREAAVLCSRRGQQPAFGLLPLLGQCVLVVIVQKLTKSDFPKLEPFLHTLSALLSEKNPRAVMQKDQLKTAEHCDHCFAPSSRLCGYQDPPISVATWVTPRNPPRAGPTSLVKPLRWGWGTRVQRDPSKPRCSP